MSAPPAPGGGSLPLQPQDPALRFPRNVLAESARIARGKIADLARLSAADHDAVIFPGGFGAAKNLYVVPATGPPAPHPGPSMGTRW